MGIQIDNYPPGPCGQCGNSNSVEVSTSKEWSENMKCYGESFHSILCINCGAETKKEGDLIECFGGKPGYVVGLNGPKLEDALKKAGWTKIKKFNK